MPILRSYFASMLLLAIPTAMLQSTTLRSQTGHEKPAGPADESKETGLFPDGSRIVWLGDSLTHACLYTRFLEDYARSRYPDRRLLFVNAGVSADTTADVLLRFDEDVSPWKPSSVFVCLGMNDGAFRPYDPLVFQLYQKSMAQLLDRIHKLGAQARVLSPTPVDSRSQFRKTFKLAQIPADYQLVLARMRDWLRSEAARRKLPFTDIYTPLLNIQELLQLENPGASITPDGIHPNAAGHALMALAILAKASEVRLRWALAFPLTGKPSSHGGRLTRFERIEDGLRFRFRASSLPWVLPPEAMAAAHLDPSYRKINRCLIQAAGLPNGIYELRIDGSTLGRHTARQWARGVDIGLLSQHPDWLQSLRITEENALRSTYIYKVITHLWIARYKVHGLARNGHNGRAEQAQIQNEVEKITKEIIELAKKIWTSDAYLTRIRNPLARNYEIRRMR